MHKAGEGAAQDQGKRVVSMGGSEVSEWRDKGSGFG